LSAALHMGRADADATATTTHQLYERYGRQIYAYCLHQLRSREEAEDAVQTTFLNAFRSLKDGAVTHAEQAWLYKIAQNVCTARRSSSARRLRLETPNDFDMLQETIPAQNRESAVELIGLEEALERMPENQRRAILLREWKGLSYREIGEELELSQASVEMLIFRARRTLAGALDQPADEKKLKRKVGRTLNLGSLVTALKSLLTGGAAVKAVALAVAAGTISVTTSAVQHTIVRSRPHTPAHTATTLSVAPLAAQTIVRSTKPLFVSQRTGSRSLKEQHVTVTPRFGMLGGEAHPDDDVTIPPVTLVAPVVVPPPAQEIPVPAPPQPVQESIPAPAVPKQQDAPPQSTSRPSTPSAPTPSPKSQAGDGNDKKRKPQDNGGDPAAARPTTTASTTTAPTSTTTQQTDDHGNGKGKKNQDPAPAPATTTPTSATLSIPPPSTTTAPVTTTPTPPDDRGNGKQRKNEDQPAATTPAVTTPTVTTPTVVAAPLAPIDPGRGKGHNK